MTLLRYHDKWLEYGLLSEDVLRGQVEDYQTSHDKSTEHYRYAAFRHVLKEHHGLDDMPLAHYAELAELDDDPGMASAALTDLIVWPRLTEQQFSMLAAFPAFDTVHLQKTINRKRLLNEIKSGPVTDALFKQCLAGNDRAVQRALIDAPNLSRQQCEALRDKGVSRAVRNLATVKLRRS